MTGLKIATAASGVGLLAAAATPLDTWARLAIEAPLVAIIGVLLLRTLPQLSEQHRGAVEKLADEIGGLAAELKESNGRLIRLLEGEPRETTPPTSCAMRTAWAPALDASRKHHAAKQTLRRFSRG